jgi:hypothetical protein
MCHIVVTWVLWISTLNKYQSTPNYITAVHTTSRLPIPMSLWCPMSRDEQEGEGQGNGVVFICKAHPGHVVLVLLAVVDAP